MAIEEALIAMESAKTATITTAREERASRRVTMASARA